MKEHKSCSPWAENAFILPGETTCRYNLHVCCMRQTGEGTDNTMADGTWNRKQQIGKEAESREQSNSCFFLMGWVLSYRLYYVLEILFLESLHNT